MLLWSTRCEAKQMELSNFNAAVAEKYDQTGLRHVSEIVRVQNREIHLVIYIDGLLRGEWVLSIFRRMSMNLFIPFALDTPNKFSNVSS
jgi:predicted RNA-binding protein with RPS1 domain